MNDLDITINFPCKIVIEDEIRAIQNWLENHFIGFDRFLGYEPATDDDQLIY